MGIEDTYLESSNQIPAQDHDRLQSEPFCLSSSPLSAEFSNHDPNTRPTLVEVAYEHYWAQRTSSTAADLLSRLAITSLMPLTGKGEGGSFLLVAHTSERGPWVLLFF